MNEAENILSVQNVNVFHGSKTAKRRQVLFDMSFSLKRGEILGVVGESGSGKTTLVKTILGINNDYKGLITVGCERPQMVFQDPYSSLNPSRKIGWLLEEPLKNNNCYAKVKRRKMVAHMLERVGLNADYAMRYPYQLSGGERQRVSIAAALIQTPRLLIADEPVSSLDPKTEKQILELLKKLHREMGLSIIFISHDLRIIRQLCERVLVISQGVISEAGRVEDIFAQPQAKITKRLLKAAGMEMGANA
ncbi:MAG: ATP-binding cassette domain-containing protein [Lachnospiraceae bacterium]|jgi:peptide/nickel transport system ATP-binding protein|nr:ATP-binding cassette domain-containing protein [Lachnospiraceae bacterium]